MKKLLLLTLLAIGPTLMFGQRKPKIKGSRVLTQESNSLPEFNAIEVKDGVAVTLRKSRDTGYEIEADDNLIDVFKFEVLDSTLVISSFYTVTAKKKLDIVVDFTSLNRITVNNGKVKSEDLISNEVLYFNSYGKSSMDLRASAGFMDLILDDAGAGDLNLDVDSLNIRASKKVKMGIYATSESSSIIVSDKATLDFEGTCQDLDLDASGDARFRGAKLICETVNVSAQDNATVRTNVSDSITLASRGGPKTFLYGNPKISITEFLDKSQLIKKEK